MKALIKNDSVAEYPYSVGKLRAANPMSTIPNNPAALAEWGLEDVEAVEQPALDVATQKAVEGTPVKVGAVWRQVWTVQSKTTQESEDYSAEMIQKITAERERRLAEGFDYDFGDGRGVHTIGTTEGDMTGWSEVSTASSAAIAVGLGAMEINIVTNTGAVTVTALEWQSILLAAAQFRQPIWGASFALAAIDPIPADISGWAGWP